MTTDRPCHSQHRSHHLNELSGRQVKGGTVRSNASLLGSRRRTGLLAGLAGWLVRTSRAHAGIGHERSAITQSFFFFLKRFMPTMVSVGILAEPAFAHEAPIILPTRLDFDASHAPKKCNDPDGFRSLLGAWVPADALRDDAERRLIVRIQSSLSGGERADVSLLDGEGGVLAERHTPHAARVECHKVLWSVARDAATMLGAFEPPLPKTREAGPVCPPPTLQEPVSCPPAYRCPICSPPSPTPTLLPIPYRSFIGLGGFVASGVFTKLGAGPNLLFGFVPWRQMPSMHLELETSWTSQTVQSMRVHAIPFVGSLCWVRGIVRFCGGLSTTIFLTNQSAANDALHILLGGNIRVGTELFSYGAFSIRADVFGRMNPASRELGKALGVVDKPTPFAGGGAILGLWSFD